MTERSKLAATLTVFPAFTVLMWALCLISGEQSVGLFLFGEKTTGTVVGIKRVTGGESELAVSLSSSLSLWTDQSTLYRGQFEQGALISRLLKNP